MSPCQSEKSGEGSLTGLGILTQLAMVKLEIPKFTAGVVAYSPDPLRYIDGKPSSSLYIDPFLRLF